MSYAQTVGILLLGIFTVVWTNRTKKVVTEVKKEVGEIHHKINSMRENELKVTKDLGEAVGAEAGRQQKRTEDREDKIDNISLQTTTLEAPPVKVVVTQPADVNIVEDKTKK